MATSTVRKPRVKPIRTATVTSANDSGGRVLTLRVGRQVNDYYLKPVPCEDGMGYEVSKLQGEGETYHVLLANDGNHTCECLGHLHHGHKTRCKHVAALLALHSAGRI